MFKVVPSKPYFSVSSEGEVMWNTTKRVLSPFKDKDGYLRVTYRSGGKSYHVAPHRAVAEVFVKNSNPEKYKIVNHINSIREDNRPTNLEWTDSSGNRNHCQFVGNHNVTGEDHSQAVIDLQTASKICELLSLGVRQVDISTLLGVERHIVSNIKHGKSWREVAKGYNLDIPKKDTMSLSTLKWIKSKTIQGEALEDILKLNPNLCSKTKIDIKELLKLVKCND